MHLNQAALEALRSLREGNERFANNVRSLDALMTASNRAALTAGQSPRAVVLSCSDSRVPSEIVFDCGLGDLFVVRVAGNIVAPSLVGSVEFAVAAFGTPLVVVMGHTNCGAVAATIDAVQHRQHPGSENLLDIVSRIAPSVVDLVGRVGSREEMMRIATRANVRSSVDRLRHGSSILEQRVASGQLVIVGAEYSLETGRVEFFEGV
ncbi:MAG: carbonic anhydrase [Deltaproteobacteria bacterium]|nr:carbonic anhydrase [Deltaproteobacteria bacterium]